MTKVYKIDVDCANCAVKLEETARKTSGVKDAAVNFMAQKIHIEFEDGVSPAEIMPDLRMACRKIYRGCEIYI